MVLRALGPASLITVERSFAAADQHDFAVEQVTKNFVVEEAKFLHGVDLLVHVQIPECLLLVRFGNKAHCELLSLEGVSGAESAGSHVLNNR